MLIGIVQGTPTANRHGFYHTPLLAYVGSSSILRIGQFLILLLILRDLHEGRDGNRIQVTECLLEYVSTYILNQ
jgi:hypothetical protein